MNDPELSMSMFANRNDYESAVATRNSALEDAAAIAERMRPVGGRAWTEDQALCYRCLTECAANIRALVRDKFTGLRKAHAEGKQIQMFFSGLDGGVWKDVEPQWARNREYRIKPTPDSVEQRLRNAFEDMGFPQAQKWSAGDCGAACIRAMQAFDEDAAGESNG